MDTRFRGYDGRGWCGGYDFTGSQNEEPRCRACRSTRLTPPGFASAADDARRQCLAESVRAERPAEIGCPALGIGKLRVERPVEVLGRILEEIGRASCRERVCQYV